MSRIGYSNEEWDRLLAILPDVLEKGVSLTEVMKSLATRTKAYDRGSVRQVVHGYRRHLGFEWDHDGQNPKLRKCTP